MQDIFKPSGTTKASKPDAGGANIRGVPVFGVVKNNIDPTRSGRLQVYVSDFGSNDPDNPSSWTTVSYMSTFFGSVMPKAGDTGYGDYKANPSSYGVWNSPPDIGTTVICLFVNGDPNYGYYIGCVPETEALYMVPAIGAAENVIMNQGEANGYGGATRLPVTNINTNNQSIANSPDFLNKPRPVHSYSAAVMSQQGIIRDAVRGPISSSAQRESPSRVGWGVSTPGRPIYEGGHTDNNIVSAVDSAAPASSLRVVARRGGHSIVMDDGDLIGQDQLIRIRTAMGHQITMSDDGQTLLILHSNGQSYIELGKEGTIDMYSTNSVNIRTQGDLNLHADNNVNIHAAKQMNIHAEEMNIHSEKNTNHKVGSNYSVYSVGDYTHKVLGALSMKAGGDAGFAASGVTFINGQKVNLNSGSISTVPQSVQPIQIIKHTDTLFDTVKGFVGAPNKLNSITSRTPAHMPWADAGKGVDVRTTNAAAGALPAAPSSAIASTNQNAATSPVSNPVTPANAATVPVSNAVSASIDKNTTSALLGSVAQDAATGPAAAAVAAGVGTVNTEAGNTLAVGSFASTGAQICDANYLKPGAGALVDSLVKGGANVQSAMPNNLWTGVNGVTGVDKYLGDVNAQVSGQITILQKSQSALVSAGAITGKESPTAIAGVVMSGGMAGVNSTLTAVRQVTNAVGLPTSTLAGVSGVVNNVNRFTNAGNFAASMAASSLGGLAPLSKALTAAGGVTNAVSAISEKGLTATGFAAVLDQLKPLAAFVPQNLRQIAIDNAKARSATSASSGLNGVTSALNMVNKASGGLIGNSPLLSGANDILNSATTLGSMSTTSAILGAGSSLLKNIDRVGSTLTSTTTNDAAVTGLFSAPRATGPITVEQAASSIGGSINAVKSLGNAQSIGTIVGSGLSLLRNVQRVIPASGSATSASGIDTLPGGENSVTAVTNSTGSSNMTNAQGLTSLINNSGTSATTGISLSQSLSAAQGAIGGVASSISNGLTTALSTIKFGNTTLAGLVNTLPAGTAASLNSAAASVQATGANPASTPVAGVDTNDRSGIDVQTASLLGDPKIPPPTYGAPASSAKTAYQVYQEKQVTLSKLTEEKGTLMTQAYRAAQAVDTASTSLPKGDPGIALAQQDYLDAKAKLAAKQAEIDAVIAA